jgi:hypothetical protein
VNIFKPFSDEKYKEWFQPWEKKFAKRWWPSKHSPLHSIGNQKL